jgi:deferrochelatase/peroxidase EfeB
VHATDETEGSYLTGDRSDVRTDGPPDGTQVLPEPHFRSDGHSRRSFLKGLGVAAGFAIGAGTVAEEGPSVDHPASNAAPLGSIVPFYGPHQAGIATPPPTHFQFASYDLVTSKVNDLIDLLRAWTTASAALAAGQRSSNGNGAALRLAPSSLTLTFGFGPGVFDERFGIQKRRPSRFGPLPPFATDQLDAAISGGDLMVQACATDKGVPAQAVQHLSHLVTGLASIRWEQTGFRPRVPPGRIADPRNLLGFKDGTANPRPPSRAFDSAVWISGADRPSWLRGGTYVCARRIRTNIAAFDRLSVPDQEVVIGRYKKNGAPLSGGTEFSPLRLDKLGSDGQPAIPIDSHVRLASDVVNRGATMLRRGYSYDNGVDLRSGVHDEGLLFLAYVRDIENQFVRIQERLAASDRLNSFVTPVGSAVFVVPPGIPHGGWIGQSLFSGG